MQLLLLALAWSRPVRTANTILFAVAYLATLLSPFPGPV